MGLAPLQERVSLAVWSGGRGFRRYILLGLGLDLLLDGTLSHGFVVRGGSFLDKVARRFFEFSKPCRKFLSPAFLSPHQFLRLGKEPGLGFFESPPKRRSLRRLLALHPWVICSVVNEEPT